jgi:hypothetical protein
VTRPNGDSGVLLESAVYLYCLVHDRSEPSLAKAPKGLAFSSRLRLIEVGPHLWLVVADVPLSRYGEDTLNRRLHDVRWVSQCALAHEAVVEHFIGCRAVLPMKLFTIMATEERAVAHVTGMREVIDRSLRSIRGCVEWSVKVRFDPRPSLGDARTRQARHVAGTRLTGTRFLRAKLEMKHAAREIQEEARKAVLQLFDRLGRISRRRTQPRPLLEGPVVSFDCAFLVARASEGRFRAAVERHVRSLAGRGFTVSTTGPWPPYNFVEGAP